MHKLVIFSLIFMLGACTKVHEVKKKNGIYYLSEIESEITQLKHITWEVGLEREVEISKGIRVSVSVPVISDRTKNILYNKHGIDSWIYRFSRKRKGRSDALGYVFYHFNNITRSTKAFTLNIYYHAATVSERFRRFHCPAFEHRAYLPEISLEKKDTIFKDNIFVKTMPKIKSRVDRLGFTPLIFSAGRSMLGDYQVDMALYNTKTKQRFSGWLPVGKEIRVNAERKKEVASCAGIKEEDNPLPQSQPLDIRNLELR